MSASLLGSVIALSGCSSSSSGNPPDATGPGAGGSNAAGSGGSGGGGASGGTAGTGTAGSAGSGTGGSGVGSAGTGGGASGGQGGAGNAGAGASGAAGAGDCNALGVSGPQIAKASHPGPAPTMTGGDIAPGTYLLTAMDKYNGTQGANTKRETWVFTPGHVEVAGEDTTNGTVKLTRASGAFSVTGNMVTVTLTCPAGAGSITAQLTAGNGTLSTLSQPQSSDQEIHTFTKQ